MKIFSDLLIEKLKSANSIVVLTGAGVSAESGVPTFRDNDGLWNNFEPEELASMEGFMKNPEMVWQWYKWRQKIIEKVEPNSGHYALAKMEKYFTGIGKIFSLITQNVDGLHKKAGSKNIYELHGNIMNSKCTNCNYTTDQIDYSDHLPTCIQCGHKLRPDIVWFGEQLPEEQLDKAFYLSENSDVFLSIGTSSLVYPAAMLPVYAIDEGSYTVEINPEKSPISYLFNEEIREKSGIVLPQIVEKLFMV